MCFPSTFPLFQQDPVFIFRNYLSLVSTVNQSLTLPTIEAKEAETSYHSRAGEELSELRPVNQALFALDFELWAKWLRDAKGVSPACGSAWAPALLLAFVHACLCGIPINSGDSQSPSSAFPFWFCWPNKRGLSVVVACHGSALTEREFTSHHHSAVRSRHHQPYAVYGLGAGARGPERLAPKLTVRAWQS